VAAAALIAAVGCSTPPAAEPASNPTTAAPSAAPQPAATKHSDAMARADQLVADAARREAEYQQTLKDQQERKGGIPVYDQYTPLGEPVEGPLPTAQAGRPEWWWRAQVQELRRRIDHNSVMNRQAFNKLQSARANLQKGEGDGPTLRLALRDAEAEYARFSRAMYRDSDHLHFFRQEARQMGIPKEWLD
jgi:hypothetical protein